MSADRRFLPHDLEAQGYLASKAISNGILRVALWVMTGVVNLSPLTFQVALRSLDCLTIDVPKGPDTHILYTWGPQGSHVRILETKYVLCRYIAPSAMNSAVRILGLAFGLILQSMLGFPRIKQTVALRVHKAR